MPPDVRMCMYVPHTRVYHTNDVRVCATLSCACVHTHPCAHVCDAHVLVRVTLTWSCARRATRLMPVRVTLTWSCVRRATRHMLVRRADVRVSM